MNICEIDKKNGYHAKYLNDNDSLSFVKIAGNSPVLIPANSMKIVTCTTRQRNDRSENYCAVVQAIQGTHGALNRSLLLVDSYPEIVNGRIPVRLLNVGHESILLNPKTRVGILQNAKVVYVSAIEESIDIDVSQSEIHVSINKIRKSCCPYAAPVVIVRKSDNSLRLCVDYR